MGMSIDKSITELEILKKNTFSYMSAYQAFTTAVNIMRMYQKIEEIVEAWKADVDIDSYDCMTDIYGVIENGNVD